MEKERIIQIINNIYSVTNKMKESYQDPDNLNTIEEIESYQPVLKELLEKNQLVQKDTDNLEALGS